MENQQENNNNNDKPVKQKNPNRVAAMLKVRELRDKKWAEAKEEKEYKRLMELQKKRDEKKMQEIQQETPKEEIIEKPQKTKHTKYASDSDSDSSSTSEEIVYIKPKSKKRTVKKVIHEKDDNEEIKKLRDELEKLKQINMPKIEEKPKVEEKKNANSDYIKELIRWNILKQ